MTFPAELASSLQELAGRDRVLVCCDYDGTLAPIVEDPERAFPLPGAAAAMTGLAACPGVSAALVSGRAVRDLKRLSGFSAGVDLVGSHGAEFAEGVFPDRGDAESELLRELIATARDIVAGVPGAAVEEKPVSVAVHVRRASRPDADRVLAQVADRMLDRERIFVTHGKEVIEVAVVHADKGDAVAELKQLTGSAAVLFIGDDVTDERAFAKLGPDDIGVKVGPGTTGARFRVASPAEVLAVLHRFGELRGCPGARPA